MQNRMKTHPLEKAQIDALLAKAEVATFATLNEDGAPYAIPVHFVHLDGKLYFHGLPVGQKISNFLRDDRVCLTVYDLAGYILGDDGEPCSVNTEYESVIVLGTAKLMEPSDAKNAALSAVVAKYTPQLAGKPIPEKMVNGTGVIEITPTEITGKYYK